MTVAIEQKLAELARAEIERHDEWDSLHTMMVICRTGDDSVSVRTVAAIDPAFDPVMYPVLIEALAKESASKGEPPYALLLQIEAYGATVSDEERLRLHATGGSLKDRPDSREECWAWVADVHGNLWSAMKDRDEEDVIDEQVYEASNKSYDGRFIKALTDSLRMYGSEYPVKKEASE